MIFTETIETLIPWTVPLLDVRRSWSRYFPLYCLLPCKTYSQGCSLETTLLLLLILVLFIW